MNAVFRTIRPRRPFPFLSSILLLILTVPMNGLVAQTAEEILQTTVERHEARMEGVQNYTVVQEVMGFESTTYFEQTEVDGHATFVARTTLGSEAGQNAPKNPYAAFLDAAEGATLEGTETVDGVSCQLVKLTNLEGSEIFGNAQAGEGSFQPDEATFCIDTDDYLVRKMALQGTASMQGTPQDVSFTAIMSDYREVEGMMHPFQTQVTTSGFGQQMSEEEVAQMRQSMEEMRAQMENMPEAQRKMMEGMMGGQIEKMEQMLASGSMDFTVTVKEIRVNQGPPSGGG